jgi:O-antigen ligase
MVDALSFFAKRHKIILMRMAVVGGVIGLMASMGYLATRVEPLIIPIAIVAPMGVLVVLKRLELGLMAMMLSAVFVRFRIPTGTASEIVFSLLICAGILGLWLLNMLLVDKRLALKPAPTNTPLLAFIVTVFVSLGWSWTFRDVFVHQAGSPFVLVASAAVMALLPATFLIVANLVRDVRWLQAIVILFLLEGLVSLLITLAIDLGIGPRETIIQLVFRNQFIWVNTHGLFSMWYLALSIALAVFNRRLHWLWRGALLLYAAVWVYWGFFLRLTWLTGWVPPFVAAAVIAFLRSKKLFVVLLVAIVVGAGGFYLRTGFEAETEESGGTRLAAYEVNWRVTSKHLLFGTGPAGYASYYMSYFPTEAMASHSNYIDLIAQTGIVGTFFYLWFFGAQVWGSYKLQRKLKDRGDFATSLSAAVLAGTIGCVIAMALGDWLFPFAYTQGIVGFDSAMLNWLFMGSIWALHYRLTSKTTDTSQTDEGATA